MATVQLINGRIAEGVQLTGMERVKGQAYSAVATAHIDGKMIRVCKLLPDFMWYEQASSSQVQKSKG